MTIDWLFIGFALGFVTAAWICPAVGKAYRKLTEDRNHRKDENHEH